MLTMAVRKVIQDSDDEDESDHGSPSASKVPPHQGGSTVVDFESSSAAYTSVRSAEPSTGSTGKRICALLLITLLTCEAETLAREILNAQNSLLDSTPSGNTSDAIITQPITTTQPPNMSKLKRRQTTGGTPDPNTKRVLRTYGAKASKDDFDFHGNSDDGGDIIPRKRQKHDDVSVGQVLRKGRHEKDSNFPCSSASNDPLHEKQDDGQRNIATADVDNDTIITAVSRAKRSRAMSLSVIHDAHEVTLTTHTNGHGSQDTGSEYSIGNIETPLGDSAIKKKRSRRRLTTHYGSSAAQQDASAVHSEPMSGGAPVSTMFETALSDMGGLSRGSPDVLSLAQDEPHIHSNSTSTWTEMLPPLVKHVLALQPNWDSSCPSTVPNTTPSQPSQAEATAANERSSLKPLSWSSTARMTSPTIAGNSTQEVEHASEHSDNANIEGQTKPPESAVNIQLAEENTTTNSASRRSPPAKARSQPPVLLATNPRTSQELVNEIKYELSNPSAAHEGSGTNPQPSKEKLKRKARDDIQTDELNLDDIAVGLPKEQYQPRPSRSRANRGDDEFLRTVDFSKRPEAVAKAKIKRRRTTGGYIPTHEDVTVENIADLGDDEPKALRKTKNKRMKATGDQDAPDGNADIVDVPRHDSDGTEKHGEGRVTSIPIEKGEMEETVDVVDYTKSKDIDEVPKPIENTEEPKKKRGRPRKKTTEETPSLPDPLNDNPPAAPAATAENPINAPAVKITLKRRKTDDKTTTTTTQISEERVISDDESHHPNNPLTATNKPHSTPLASPPRQPKPRAPPVQTPQKPAPKGPDKHSPLNSGKVPYRVGLSKKARIEPLLRVVRK